MIETNQTQIDCDKIRKMVITQLNPDNSKTTITLYFNVETGDQLTERQAQLCPDIQALEFSCAVVCDPE